MKEEVAGLHTNKKFESPVDSQLKYEHPATSPGGCHREEVDNVVKCHHQICEQNKKTQNKTNKVSIGTVVIINRRNERVKGVSI